MLISLESTLLYTLHKIQCTSELIRVKLNFIGVVRLRLTPITHITAVLVFTGQCHNQLPLLQKQSTKKESRVEQKAKINVFSDYSLESCARCVRREKVTKVTKICTKNQKTKIWDEQDISFKNDYLGNLTTMQPKKFSFHTNAFWLLKDSV